jgi:hypothetical protein
MDQLAAPTIKDGPIDSFIDAFCRRRPVSASFLGVKDYDHLLPDFSENGIADTVAEMRSLRERLRGESVDERLARNFIDIQIAEFQGNHFQRSNPALYTGEAIFGVLTSPRRLAAVAGFLKQAGHNIQSAPLEWTQRAIKECRAAIVILKRMPNAETALKAFGEFHEYLQSDLICRQRAQYGCGGEFFDLLMARGHMLRESTGEFLRFANQEFERHRNAVAPPDNPLIQDLSEHQRCWDSCRKAVEERNLLTWPEFPLVFKRPPDLVRDAAGDLYYLSYRSPAPADAPVPHVCEVNPCGPITLKLNHVVHHAGPGHHVQNYFAYRSESRLSRIAAVDCANRIAMFAGGTMAEGWACYATDLMEEAGFFTPEEKVHQEHTRLRMAARAIVDIKFHRSEMTFAEAVDFYRRRVEMSEDAARKEAVRNSMFPGTAMMYLAGTSAIHRLRKQFERKMPLRDFHDRLLSYGSIPVTLIEDLMSASLNLGVETNR